MEELPLHEVLRYHPNRIETRLRQQWYAEGINFVEGDANTDLADLRVLAFEDFFTRAHRMYATVHPELGDPEVVNLDDAVVPLARAIGCRLSKVSGSDVSEAKAINAQSISSYIDESADLLRLALLRSKPFTDVFDADSLDFAGPARFLQRLWRLCRTETDDLPKVRFGPPLAFDTEVSEQIADLSNSCFEAFRRRSAGQYIAAIATANNELHRYVFSEIGPHSTTIAEATKSLVLHLVPVCPFVATELWDRRFSNKETKTAL